MIGLLQKLTKKNVKGKPEREIMTMTTTMTTTMTMRMMMMMMCTLMKKEGETERWLI
jgi:hypothetical protein